MYFFHVWGVTMYTLRWGVTPGVVGGDRVDESGAKMKTVFAQH